MTRLQNAILLASLAVLAIAGALWLTSRRPPLSERLERRAEERRIFSFEPKDIRSISVRTASAGWSLSRDPRFGWRLEAPISWPADLEKAKGLSQRIAWMESDRVVFEEPTAEELERTGLSKPRVRIEAQTRSGSHQVDIGRANPLVERVFVRTDRGPVRGVPEPYLVPFSEPFESLRQTRIFPVAKDSIEQIRLTRGSTTGWVVQRQGDGWKVRATAEEPWRDVETGEAGVLLALVTLRLEADRFLADGLEALDELPGVVPEVGRLVRRPVVLEVRLDGGYTRTVTLSLAERSFSAEQVPVAWVEGTAVEMFPDPVRELMEVSAHELRDRVLSRFSRRDVARIEVRYANQEPLDIVLEDDRWQRAGSGRAVLHRRVSALVRRLAYLRGRDTITLTPTRDQLRAFGLEPALRRLRFFDASDALLADVRLGADAGEGFIYAKGTKPRVDLVPKNALLKIPQEVGELLSRSSSPE
jgi:hypothetical protein